MGPVPRRPLKRELRPAGGGGGREGGGEDGGEAPGREKGKIFYSLSSTHPEELLERVFLEEILRRPERAGREGEREKREEKEERRLDELAERASGPAARKESFIIRWNSGKQKV